MYGDKSELVPAGRDLVRLVLEKKFADVETHDAALTVLQSANTFRVDDDTPGPFGATPDEIIRSDNEAVKAAEQLDAELGAVGDHEDDEPAESVLGGLLVSLAAFVARKFLERWLSR